MGGKLRLRLCSPGIKIPPSWRRVGTRGSPDWGWWWDLQGKAPKRAGTKLGFPRKTPGFYNTNEKHPKVSWDLPSAAKVKTQSTNLARNGIIFRISARILLLLARNCIFLFSVFAFVWFLLLAASTNGAEDKFHGLSRRILQGMQKHLCPRWAQVCPQARWETNSSVIAGQAESHHQLFIKGEKINVDMFITSPCEQITTKI